MRRTVAVLALALAVLAAAGAAAADEPSDLAFQPHPGSRLPLAAVLDDTEGRAIPLGRFFAGRPVLLVLEYLHCKTFCGLTLRDVIGALDALPPEAGGKVQLLAIDIDPRDTPADAGRARAEYLAGAHSPGIDRDIHFLTGPEAAVRPIADAIGFPYRYDAASDQYLHPAGFIVAAPDGTISRYFFGAGALPAELQQSLTDAAAGQAVGPIGRLLLLCRGEGASLGRYTLPVLAAFTAADLVATAALVALFAAIRRRRHR
jgi:protein SCO1/2